MAAVQDLGQRQVVSRLGLRPRPHRRAEAGRGGLEAVHGDDERVLTARGVVGVGVRPAEEHLVLDRDPVQLARPHADERQRRAVRLVLLDDEAVVLLARPPEADAGRQQELLPRVRPDRVPEAGLVVAALEPVAARLLVVRPADREIGRRLDVVVDDRAVAHRRADGPKAVRRERPQQIVEGLGLDHGRCDVRQARPLLRPSPASAVPYPGGVRRIQPRCAVAVGWLGGRWRRTCGECRGSVTPAKWHSLTRPNGTQALAASVGATVQRQLTFLEGLKQGP